MRRTMIFTLAAGVISLLAAETTYGQFYGGRRGVGVGVRTGNFELGYGQPNYGWGNRGFYNYPGVYGGWQPYYGWNTPNYQYYGYGPRYYGGYWDGYQQGVNVPIETAQIQGQDPGYSSFYSNPGMRDRQVELRISVPNPTAQVTIEGRNTMQRGLERTFVSPPLEPGKDYVYTVKATWMDQGREVTREKKIDVKPGENFTVNFTEQEGDHRDHAGDRQARPMQPVDGVQPVQALDANRVRPISGTIVRVEGNRVVVKDTTTNTEHTFRVLEGADVMLSGKTVDLQQLKTDMRVTVTSDPGATGTASRIEATPASADDR